MRKYLNDNWYFKPDFRPEYLEHIEPAEFTPVRIPHTVREIPFNYVNNRDYQMVSTYYTELDLSPYAGKVTTLVFEGNAHYSEVYVNGTLVKTHACGYTAFRVPLTQPENNEKVRVLVKLDSRESLNQPPFGNVIDYLTYGGIYRDTYLEIKNISHIHDVFVKASMDKSLTLEMCYLHLQPGQTIEVSIAGVKKVFPPLPELKLTDLPVELWDTEHPNLYDLTVALTDGETVLDTWQTPVGFRTVTGDRDGIYLNGKKIKIRGLNRHQSYAYVGYAMPERVQRRDAQILKFDLGLNAVRTSHYPDSQDFISECDRIGLLVFTELPGWQYIGDAGWQDQAVSNVRDMVLQYRNHPSIFLWGVRINESQDNHDFYVRTNQAARELDDTRLIGGVRCFKNSELLEDVYTYNDFVHSGSNQGAEPRERVTKDRDHAYLITEYNGHMYPTKPFDDEIHRTQHLRRHYQVLNDVTRHENIAGSFGWCMADYNTHKDFGSGDQICYHGVLDMFRNPKLAAWAYASQREDTPIMAVNSTMDIGEHPGGFIQDILVMTNCDCVRLCRGEEVIGEFRSGKKYRFLKHPPVEIRDLIGDSLQIHEGYSQKKAALVKKGLLAIQKYGLSSLPLRYLLLMGYLFAFRGLSMEEGTRLYETYIGAWGDENQAYCLEGIKDGKVVQTIRLESFRSLLWKIQPDTTELSEGKSYDVASVTIEACNQAGNHLFYFQEPVTVEAQGAVELIGPSQISLKGGYSGFYVKSRTPGTGKVKVLYQGEVVKELTFTVTSV